MLKKKSYILLICILSINVTAQNESKSGIEERLLQHFKTESERFHFFDADSLYESFFDSQYFNLSISNAPITFRSNFISLKNPYFSNKYEDSEVDAGAAKNYPKSYSVIYQNHLVALFENGKFACFKLDTYERNTELETEINTKNFTHHWIIDQQLIAQTNHQKFVWDSNKWAKYNKATPLKNQSVLFDDHQFIVFKDCFGEWGGKVYFYEKATSKIYFTEATCANTVNKTTEGYEILSTLGHFTGFSEVKLIPDPTKLTATSLSKINKKQKGNDSRETDNSNAYTKKLELQNILLFSVFQFRNQDLYLAYSGELAFLAKSNQKDFEIVALFPFNDFYTHNPITTKYNEYTLINLDGNDSEEREASLLLIYKNQITKINWNDNPSQL